MATLDPIAMVDADAKVRGSSKSRLWLPFAACLFGVFWGLLFYGLIDLLAFAQGEEFHATLLLSTGWGLVFVFLIAAPVVALGVRASAVSSSALAELALV